MAPPIAATTDAIIISLRHEIDELLLLNDVTPTGRLSKQILLVVLHSSM